MSYSKWYGRTHSEVDIRRTEGEWRVNLKTGCGEGLSKRRFSSMKENGGRRRNTSNEASFPHLFNIELMLSCVMTRSQTLRYSTGGSRRVSDGLCESTQRTSYNAPLCLDCSASYGPILPHIPPSPTPLPPDMLRGYRNRGARASAYFFFQTQLSLLREKGPSGDLVVKSTFLALANTHILPRMNIIHLCLVQRSTCMLTWTRTSERMLMLAFRLPQWAINRRSRTHWVDHVQVQCHPKQHESIDLCFYDTYSSHGLFDFSFVWLWSQSV